MSVIGIIAEYNPFHNGHKYQLEQIKKQEPDAKLVVVMSGNFTQRGTAAIQDKWLRARLAIENGIDLVIENPFACSVRSAQTFAEGGIRILKSLGIVEQLAFGAEYTNLNELQQMADGIQGEESQALLHTYIQQGDSYAAVLGKVLTTRYAAAPGAIKQPNTILALEYLKALQRLAPQIRPMLLPRVTAAYHDSTLYPGIASATAIRTELKKASPDFQRLKETMPLNVYTSITKQKRQNTFPDIELLFRPLRLQAITHSAEKLQKIYGINEGLEHRFLHAVQKAASLDELRRCMQNKRYPGSRMQRLLLYILLDLSAAQIDAFDQRGPLYSRILAFNDTGRQLLHDIKQQAALPLITKPSAFCSSRQRDSKNTTLAQQMFTLDTQATDLYALCQKAPPAQGLDFTMTPSYITS